MFGKYAQRRLEFESISLQGCWVDYCVPEVHWVEEARLPIL